MSKELNQNGVKYRTILFVAVLLILCVAIYGSYRPTPEIQSVNGIFRNDELGDMEIRDGVISYRETSTKFQIRSMKFGITLFPERPVSNFYSRDISDPSRLTPSPFILYKSNGKMYFKAVDFRRNEYIFVKK